MREISRFDCSPLCCLNMVGFVFYEHSALLDSNRSSYVWVLIYPFISVLIRQSYSSVYSCFAILATVLKSSVRSVLGLLNRAKGKTFFVRLMLLQGKKKMCSNWSSFIQLQVYCYYRNVEVVYSHIYLNFRGLRGRRWSSCRCCSFKKFWLHVLEMRFSSDK